MPLRVQLVRYRVELKVVVIRVRGKIVMEVMEPMRGHYSGVQIVPQVNILMILSRKASIHLPIVSNLIRVHHISTDLILFL